MATLADQAFFARLKELNEKFAAGVPAMLERLRTLLALLDAAAPATVVIGEIHQELHTIAGSAATFGFPAFGQQARNLEQQLRVLMAASTIDAAAWALWMGKLDVYLAWSAADPRREHYPDT